MLTWKVLAFPGWHCDVDDRPVPPSITAEGLLASEVPAGRHRLVVTFGSTRPRRLGAAVSVVAALALAGLGGPRAAKVPRRRQSD